MDDTLVNKLIEFEATFRLGAASGADIRRFFTAAEADITWLDQLDRPPHRIWGLLIKPKSRPLIEGFGLHQEVLVLCSAHAEFQPRLLDNRRTVEAALRTPGRLQVDLTIVLSTDVHLTEKLARLEDIRQTLWGISPDFILDALKSGEPSARFRQSLQSVMYARDFFDRSGPVHGFDFFGRARLLQDLSVQLQRGSHIGLYGLRKIGKTSILKALLERRDSLCPRLLFAHIDLLSIPPASRSHLYLLHQIGAALVREGELNSRGLPPLNTMTRFPKFDQIVDGRAFERGFDADLRGVLEACGQSDQRVVVILDEIERLFPAPEVSEGYVDYDKFLEYMRGLSQAVGPLSLFVVGVNPHISEAQFLGSQRRQNPMFGFFTTRYTQPMPLDEILEMVRQLGRSSGARFERPAVERIFEMVGGHPFLVRRFCSLLIRGRQRPVDVTATDVDHNQEMFLLSENSILAEMVSVVKEFYPDEFAVLHRIAAEEHVATESIGRQVRAHLEGYQLVEERNGRLYICNRLMHEWLRSISRAAAADISRVANPKEVQRPQGSDTVPPTDVQELVKRVELGLRIVVRKVLDQRWGARADERVRSSVGDEAFDAAIARRQTTLQRYGTEWTPHQDDILHFLYIGDLVKVVIGNEWDEFRKVFGDKRKTQESLRVVTQCRNEVEHFRPLPAREIMRLHVAASDLLDEIGPFVARFQ